MAIKAQVAVQRNCSESDTGQENPTQLLKMEGIPGPARFWVGFKAEEGEAK
jgi:hypothetical protein